MQRCACPQTGLEIFATGGPDYMLYVDGKAFGMVEAKPAGHALVGVELQSTKYATGVPHGLLTGTRRSRSATNPPAARPISPTTSAPTRTVSLHSIVRTPCEPGCSRKKHWRSASANPPRWPPTKRWPARFQPITNLEESFAGGRRRALIQMPDIVLFEGGADKTIRRELLKEADVQTLLRLPPGIFYAQGVMANARFFDRKPAQEKPWTQKLWIYDRRTKLHLTLKENTLKHSTREDFVACYNPKNRPERKESERFKSFTYDELTKRDKVNLDIFWLKDDALEESANLPAPEINAEEISDDLEAALEQFATIAEHWKK